MMLKRWLLHLTTTHLALKRHFPPATLATIDQRITELEREHRAEIRCAIETAMPISSLRKGMTSGARAAEVFAMLAVWDTAENNGLLLYILLAEQRIEIVADRAFDGRVKAVDWEAICRAMEVDFGAGQYERGTLAALDAISVLCSRHFPANGHDINELPDRAVLL